MMFVDVRRMIFLAFSLFINARIFGSLFSIDLQLLYVKIAVLFCLSFSPFHSLLCYLD
jgi:hypothetical protein